MYGSTTKLAYLTSVWTQFLSFIHTFFLASFSLLAFVSLYFSLTIWNKILYFVKPSGLTPFFLVYMLIIAWYRSLYSSSNRGYELNCYLNLSSFSFMNFKNSSFWRTPSLFLSNPIISSLVFQVFKRTCFWYVWSKTNLSISIYTFVIASSAIPSYFFRILYITASASCISSKVKIYFVSLDSSPGLAFSMLSENRLMVFIFI